MASARDVVVTEGVLVASSIVVAPGRHRGDTPTGAGPCCASAMVTDVSAGKLQPPPYGLREGDELRELFDATRSMVPSSGPEAGGGCAGAWRRRSRRRSPLGALGQGLSRSCALSPASVRGWRAEAAGISEGGTTFCSSAFSAASFCSAFCRRVSEKDAPPPEARRRSLFLRRRASSRPHAQFLIGALAGLRHSRLELLHHLR